MQNATLFNVLNKQSNDIGFLQSTQGKSNMAVKSFEKYLIEDQKDKIVRQSKIKTLGHNL